ncbi:MAG: aminotransferase class I/II-fold pyridoxal phosphate-dependent enzyme [Pseudomonadota bacterium]
MYPERFSNLPEHVWPRLRALLDVHEGGGEPVHMTIGEPKHAFPAWVTDAIARHAKGFNKYPPNQAAPELLEAICGFVQRRYGVPLDPGSQVMALNGTREGLYNAAMALCPEAKAGQRAAVLMPNPFYPVYTVASLSVGADPIMVPATEATGFLPDYTALSSELLNRVAAAYICSPANPQGVVADVAYWQSLIQLAETYDFKIFADECYSEIYRDAPPPGALQVAHEMGVDPNRVVVFHSLSKRSNLPGLRSGFVATGARNMERIQELRNYAGAPLPLPLQMASAEVWNDEEHVMENRALYIEKYRLADRIFGNVPGYRSPEAGFFLWLPVEDDEAAAVKLWRETGVRVLPGGYLARDWQGQNPGKTYIRAAMVAPKEETARGLESIRDCLFPQ